MQGAAPAPRVPRVPAADRQGGAGGLGHPSGAAQLRHAQARCGEALAGRAAALPSALHANVLVVAEPSGTLVRIAQLAGTEARQES